MASKGDTHSDKGDKGDNGHGGGDDHGKAASGAQHAKPSTGGSTAAKVLRNPITWALAGVGALAAVVFSGTIPTPTMETQPASYSSPDGSIVAESDGNVRSPSQPRAQRNARLDARECHSIVQGARADYGRNWESELPSGVRRDCSRTIQEARWVDGRTPLQVEGSRTRLQDPGNVEVVRVSVAYSDLDLSTPAGAEQVLDRVRRAAIEACGGQPDLRDLAAQRPFKECVDRSMDGAIAQLRAPRVTALYRQPG